MRALRENFQSFADPSRRHETLDVGSEPADERPPPAEDEESRHENRERRDGGRDHEDASNLDVLRWRSHVSRGPATLTRRELGFRPGKLRKVTEAFARNSA